MKKLLCIVCLLATVLFVNAADASTGSPVRNGRSTYSLNTVRLSTTCTTCGHAVVPVRTVVRPVVRITVVRRILRPTTCTRCGRRVVARRPVIRTASRPVVRVRSCTTCGRSAYTSGRRHIVVSPARYHVLSRPAKRLACTRCGR